MLVSGATDMTLRVWDCRDHSAGGGQAGMRMVNGSGPVAGLKARLPTRCCPPAPLL